MTERRTFRRELENDLHNTTEVRNMRVEQFSTLWSEQLRCCRLVETSDYYYYIHDNPEGGITEEEIPFINGAIIPIFFRNAGKAARAFQTSQRYLLSQGRQIANYEAVDFQEMVKTGMSFLEHSCTLVAGLQTIDKAQAVLPQLSFALSEIQRITLQRTIDYIGSEKPETFRETFRRYIPRWMHFPIPAPREHIEASGEILDRLWSYEVREADLLAHPDQIFLGMPLHVVFKTAKMVEDAGNADVGYLIRTWGITQVLEMEKERFAREEKREIPYFSYILPALVSGDIKQWSQEHFFDYASAVRETMQLTFSRIQYESEEKQRGLAANFLQELVDHYADIFPMLIAKSIVNHSNMGGDFDQLVALRGLRRLKLSWPEKILEHVQNLSERRLLTGGEIEDKARFLQNALQGTEVTMEEFIESIRSVVGSEDNYTFGVPLQKVGDFEKDTKGRIEIDLDTSSETVNTTVSCREYQLQKYLPFQMSFSGELESLRLDTLEGDPISHEASITYRNLVARAVRYEADKLRAKQQKNNNMPLRVEDSRLEFRSETLTREERIRLYELQRKQDSPEAKRKRRLTATPTDNDQNISESLSPDQENEASVRKIRIVGMERENVEKLLRDGGIRGIAPEQVIERLKRALYVAGINGGMLGKKISMDHYGRVDNLDLRQINWNLFGLPIRIYLQGIGGSEFLLRGILNKKDTDMQVKFVRSLVKQISREILA